MKDYWMRLGKSDRLTNDYITFRQFPLWVNKTWTEIRESGNTLLLWALSVNPVKKLHKNFETGLELDKERLD